MTPPFGDFSKKQGVKLPFSKFPIEKKKIFLLKLPKFFSPSAKQGGGHFALLPLISTTFSKKQFVPFI